MPVLYDGKALIPAPFVAVEQSVQSVNGTKVGSVKQLTLRGKLVTHKGSPNSSGDFWDQSGYPPDETIADAARLQSLLAKQKALEGLFANEGRTLEIVAFNGMTPTKYNPRVRSVAFPEGKWYDECDYVISLEVDGDDDADGISDCSEEWNIEPADERGLTFRLTHSLSATGKRQYDVNGASTAEPWENARAYVLNKMTLGLDAARMEAPGVLDATGLQAFNYVRTQSLNEKAGTFSCTETWVCYDPQGGPAAVEEFTVERRTDLAGRTVVSVSGQIQGLEVRDNQTRALTSTRHANALAKWALTEAALLSRAENLSGVDLNPRPLSRTLGQNEATGVITYAAEYDNRPSNEIAGAVSETISVSDQHPADVFASVPVIGRSYGPVLQTLGSKTARRRTVSVEALMPAPTRSGGYPSAPSTAALILSLRPPGSQVFVEQDTEEFSQQTGRYTRQVTFAWEL